MKTTIYKYKLLLDRGTSEAHIQMPIDAKILTAGVQGAGIFVWAEVNTDSGIEMRTFEVFGTGHEILEYPAGHREYLSTVFMGLLVFHVYLRKS